MRQHSLSLQTTVYIRLMVFFDLKCSNIHHSKLTLDISAFSAGPLSLRVMWCYLKWISDGICYEYKKSYTFTHYLSFSMYHVHVSIKCSSSWFACFDKCLHLTILLLFYHFSLWRTLMTVPWIRKLIGFCTLMTFFLISLGHFEGNAMPSAGIWPFLQSLVCNAENRCKQTLTPDEAAGNPKAL